MKKILSFFAKQKYLLLLITFFIIFIYRLISITPIKETFEYNRDEGTVLTNASLLLNGFSQYKEIWYDQPPLFPVILSYWFKLFGSSVYLARILVLIFSFLLLSAFYFTLKIREGRFCAFMAVIFLLLSSSYLLISVSVMRGIPALSLAMLSILFLTLYEKFYLKRFLILSGIFMALSLQTKLSGFFFIPIIILEILQVKRQKLEKPSHYLSPELLWIMTLLFVFLSINLLFFHLNFQIFIQQLFLPHLTKIPLLENNFLILCRMLLSDYDIALLALISIVLIVKQRKRESFFPLIWLATITIILLRHKPIWYHYYPLISIPVCWLGAITFAKFFSKNNLNKRINQINFFHLIILLLIILTIFKLPSKYQRSQKSLWGQTSAQEHQVLDVLSKYKKNTRWIFTDRAIFAYYLDIFIPPELVLISSKRILTDKLEPDYLINKLKKYKPELILLTGYLETFPDYYPKIMPYIEKNYTRIYKDEFLSPMPVPPGFAVLWFKEPIGKYLPSQIRHINNKWFYPLTWNSLQINIPKIQRLPDWVNLKTKIKFLIRKDILQKNHL